MYIERMSWAEGEKKQLVWFLMLMPGRFRLLSDAQIVHDQKLQEVRSAIVDGPDEIGTPVTIFETSQRAARIGRLTPANLSVT
jgi:hypothetical protein